MPTPHAPSSALLSVSSRLVHFSLLSSYGNRKLRGDEREKRRIASGIEEMKRKSLTFVCVYSRRKSQKASSGLLKREKL